MADRTRRQLGIQSRDHLALVIMTSYPIAKAAEKLIGVTVDRTGGFSRVRRWRTSDDFLVDLTAGEPAIMARSDAPVEFVVRVARDHSGVLEIAPDCARRGSACTIIPLGPERPFLESELPPSPGSDGAYSLGSEMHFQFSNATLTWTSLNLSGRIELDEHIPAVSVVLRLPTGHDGELVFVTSPPS